MRKTLMMTMSSACLLIFLIGEVQAQENMLAMPLQPQAAQATVTPPPLTRLETVLSNVYESNPTLRAARAELMAVHENLPQALGGWKPSLNLESDITNSSIENDNQPAIDGTSKSLGVSLNQPLYRGGRTMASIEAARSFILGQRKSLRNIEQIVLLDTVAAYMSVVRDRALLDLNNNNNIVISRQRDATRSRFELGETTRTDVSQAEARLSRANADIAIASSNLQASQAAYKRLTGNTAGKLGNPDVNFPFPQTQDEAREVALANNPQILAARAFHKASTYDTDNVFGELLPDVSLTGSLSRTYDPQLGNIDERDQSLFGIRASVPLYQSGTIRSRIRQAKHISNQRYILIREAENEVEETVQAAWDALTASRAEIEARKVQVEASEIARRGVEQENELGSRTVLDLLDAEQELLDARASLVTAMRNEVVAEFTLASALGFLGPQMLPLKDYTPVYNQHLGEIQWQIFGINVDSVG